MLYVTNNDNVYALREKAYRNNIIAVQLCDCVQITVNRRWKQLIIKPCKSKNGYNVLYDVVDGGVYIVIISIIRKEARDVYSEGRQVWYNIIACFHRTCKNATIIKFT